MSLDAATLALVADELKNTLLDAKIDKIFEPTRDEVLITLRTRTETHRLLLSARSGSARVCLTRESFENPLTPPGFCMLLRKHLTGGRLIELRREPGDRIVYFDFRCTNEMGDLVTNTLAVELMGRYSNLVLVQNGRIIDALKRVDFDDSEVRQLLPGLRGRTFWRRVPPPSWLPPVRRNSPLRRPSAKRWRASARSLCGRLPAARWERPRRWPAI
jgi:predicted ribosome quality control (RQC) complex YloA/Tae2 family protein